MSDTTLELDIVNEDDEDLSALRARWPKVTFDVVTEHGPGGGWPVVKVSGDRADVRDWLITDYTAGDITDAEYYLNN